MEPAIQIRRATPADIPTIMRLKLDFAREEDAVDAVRATEQDWLRDLFEPAAHFTVLLAQRGGAVPGMLIYSEKYYPAWVGPMINIHDLYVDPAHRRQRVAMALLHHLAVHAASNNMPLMELHVRDDNPARGLYSRVGFQQVQQCVTYVIAGPALLKLAEVVSDAAALL